MAAPVKQIIVMAFISIEFSWMKMHTQSAQQYVWADVSGA